MSVKREKAKNPDDFGQRAVSSYLGAALASANALRWGGSQLYKLGGLFKKKKKSALVVRDTKGQVINF